MDKEEIALLIIAILFVIVIICGVIIFVLGKGLKTGNKTDHETEDKTGEFQCGKRYEVNKARFITNGSEALLGSAPWLVSIKLKTYLPDGRVIDSHNCGGSIISPEWVLTATHCIGNINEQDQCVRKCTVIAGSMRRNDTGYGYGTVHTVVQQIPFDEDYELYNKDIALIKVSPPFKYRKPGKDGRRAIGPVCLPKQDEPIIETEGDIVGFGGTNDTLLLNEDNAIPSLSEDPTSYVEKLLQLPQTLQTARVDVISRDECATIPDDYLEEDIRNEEDWQDIIFDPEAIICAGNLEEHKFACHADSGGPFTVNNNGNVTIIGVTHIRLTPSCLEDPVWYTVFTKVAHFRDWITSKTGL